MRWLALALIRAYQHYLSPHKGFCCAYRYHTGHGSCSAISYRLIRRFGVIAGIQLTQQQLSRCSLARQRYGRGRKAARPPHLQRGDCDCGLSGLDCNPFDGGDNICDNNSNKGSGCSCCADACSWGGNDDKKQKRRKHKHHYSDEIYLPPKISP